VPFSTIFARQVAGDFCRFPNSFCIRQAQVIGSAANGEMIATAANCRRKTAGDVARSQTMKKASSDPPFPESMRLEKQKTT